ncbi:hypothetical protein JOF56_005284 [Kibdelosporangium banguiense]|uniref:Alpha/beta hydrolase fold-3 domain-containing protein n=1 Tax=Kibdelosporangium banguiense TaxID=1365924 RepID=A0ABS4TKP5_9PSEU|nr:hypothetical protein [Kibdelosporangium banguiense]MBP2324899.1 hypothetical protein [Kibdelosporangium banguiense]
MPAAPVPLDAELQAAYDAYMAEEPELAPVSLEKLPGIRAEVDAAVAALEDLSCGGRFTVSQPSVPGLHGDPEIPLLICTPIGAPTSRPTLYYMHGGGLSAALALTVRDKGGPRLLGQLLMCPMLDDRNDSASAMQGGPRVRRPDLAGGRQGRVARVARRNPRLRSGGSRSTDQQGRCRGAPQLAGAPPHHRLTIPSGSSPWRMGGMFDPPPHGLILAEAELKTDVPPAPGAGRRTHHDPSNTITTYSPGSPTTASSSNPRGSHPQVLTIRLGNRASFSLGGAAPGLSVPSARQPELGLGAPTGVPDR